ncbi:MAG TPA: hypothetical protein VM580_31680 [Labilithrix sp.]|nr:hypothetical protein [Labilithrix sp.]
MSCIGQDEQHDRTYAELQRLRFEAFQQASELNHLRNVVERAAMERQAREASREAASIVLSRNYNELAARFIELARHQSEAAVAARRAECAPAERPEFDELAHRH